MNQKTACQYLQLTTVCFDTTFRRKKGRSGNKLITELFSKPWLIYYVKPKGPEQVSNQLVLPGSSSGWLQWPGQSSQVCWHFQRGLKQ